MKYKKIVGGMDKGININKLVEKLRLNTKCQKEIIMKQMRYKMSTVNRVNIVMITKIRNNKVVKN